MALALAGPPPSARRRLPRRQQVFSLLRRQTLPLVLPLLLLLVWQGLFELHLVRPLLLPPPSQLLQTIGQLLASGELGRHVAVSLMRVIEGFALAAVAGLALGVAMGLSPLVERLCDLLVQLLKPIPPIAWIPLPILWLGIGETARVFIIFLGAFFPVLVNTIDGIRHTDPRYLELARLLEISPARLVRQVILPGALPSIMTGIRVGMMVAWMCVVASELIAASSGVGYLIMDARQLSQTDSVLAGMIAIGVLGKILDVLLRQLEQRLIRWKPPLTGTL